MTNGKEKLKTAYMISEQLVMRYENEKRGRDCGRSKKRTGWVSAGFVLQSR